jgi:hypothetical protein
MDGHFLLVLPTKESPAAIRTEELRLSARSESLLHLEKKRADLAENLRAFLAVVEVEIDIGCPAAGTDDVRRNHRRVRTVLNRSKGLTVKGFILNQELPVVFLSEVFFLNSGGSVRGGLGSTMKFL